MHRVSDIQTKRQGRELEFHNVRRFSYGSYKVRRVFYGSDQSADKAGSATHNFITTRVNSINVSDIHLTNFMLYKKKNDNTFS